MLTDVEIGNALIRFYRQSEVPPEQLSDSDFIKAYARAMALEARHNAEMEEQLKQMMPI